MATKLTEIFGPVLKGYRKWFVIPFVVIILLLVLLLVVTESGLAPFIYFVF